MELSVTVMGYVFGIGGILLYIFAPFLSDAKRAVMFRVGAEILFALMFFYLSHFAGVVYALMMAVSALLQKQIETNKWVSVAFGILSCIATGLFNNDGIPGYVLAVSLIFVFLPLDEKKMMTFTSYVDGLVALALMYYSLSFRIWPSFVFALFLMISAIAGIVAAVRLHRAGGMQAAYREEMEYQASQNKKKGKKKNGKH